MNNPAQDRVFAAVLLVVAVVWTALVLRTIPPVENIWFGPRAFPLAFGIILLILTAILLVRVGLSNRHDEKTGPADTGPESDGGSEDGTGRKVHWGPAFLLFGEIVLYGWCLQKIGFVLATPIVVLLFLLVNLRVRSPRRLAGMSLGLTVGCWLIFQKALGIHLATGTWFNLG